MQQKIEKIWESFAHFRAFVTDMALSVFGSGWVFVVENSDEDLDVRVYNGTGTPIHDKPLLAIDMWEHAYYLDYQLDKKSYLDNLFHLIDWRVIEKRLEQFGIFR